MKPGNDLSNLGKITHKFRHRFYLIQFHFFQDLLLQEMALSKGFRAFEKNCPPVYSILLEHRSKSDTLLFESQAIAVLSE